MLLGLDNAGKTTLLSQIKALYTLTSDGDAPASDTAGNTVPTVGQNVATISLPDMYIKIWDVGGQMSLRKLWQSYYKNAHAIVFVVDSTDVGGDADLAKVPGYFDASRRRKSSLSGAQFADFERRDDPVPQTPITPGLATLSGHALGRLDECRQVLESVLEHEDTAGIPILVLANKQDREDCVEVVRIKEGFVRRVFEGEQGGLVRDSRVLPISALRGTGVREAVDWVRSRVVWNKESKPPVLR